MKSSVTSTASSDPTPDSSNVTTPASEFPCQSEVNVGVDDASMSTEENACIYDTITKTKTRSLSKTFKQATTFAHNLVTPPKVRVAETEVFLSIEWTMFRACG